MNEIEHPVALLARRQLVEELRGAVQAEDLDVTPEEGDRRAVLQRVHVAQVRADERPLKLAVERVDERLNLLVDA